MVHLENSIKIKQSRSSILKKTIANLRVTRKKVAKKMEKREKDIENEKERVCKRCKKSFIASLNDSNSCRFHPSFFVCRRHDDQKRYYELGPDDPPYAAKFYDCCGAEDPNAPGCSTNTHVSYDD
ncbi:hypothetical protein Leryth_003993 [Lithospermum erythrorhizon]|nr:hypothetical protein Leryth_003993 [Lithospermum erythrorhizon]